MIVHIDDMPGGQQDTRGYQPTGTDPAAAVSGGDAQRGDAAEGVFICVTHLLALVRTNHHFHHRSALALQQGGALGVGAITRPVGVQHFGFVQWCRFGDALGGLFRSRQGGLQHCLQGGLIGGAVQCPKRGG